MTFENAPLPGVILCKPQRFRDVRGFFMEFYHAQKYMAGGVKEVFVQDSRSRSIKGVLRGLHYQPIRQQAKLVSCTHGEIFDVAVDVRRGSPTFGQWMGIVLSEENAWQLFIPKGFAHGFCVVSDVAEIFYKTSEFYDVSDDRGIRWDDPEIAIKWPIERPILSEKDKVLPFLKDAKCCG